MRRFISAVCEAARQCAAHPVDAAIGGVIRLCGYSAIVFVFGIFYFVFREGAPIIFRNSQQWYQWTADAGGTLNVDLTFKNVDGNLDLYLYDGDGHELASSQTTSDHEHVSTAVATGQVVYLKLEGVDGASQPSYSLRIDGAGGPGSLADYPLEHRSRSDAFNLGTGDQLLEDMDVLGPLDLRQFFTSAHWRPTSKPQQFGIVALLAGTLSVTALAMALAVPLGLGAAVYVSEFSAGKTRETLKIVIELLAAIPLIVWGFIGVMVLNPLIVMCTGAPIGIGILNGGIILALMSVPIIVSLGEDALKAVPDAYREAALALGCSRWQVVYKVLFPAAKNGLLAAVLLGVGRAIGETMAVLMATGHAAQIPTSILDPVQTLTATIAAELGEAPLNGDHYRVLFVVGIVLFAVAMTINLTADLVIKGFRAQKAD